MKKLWVVIFALGVCSGCMFVTESYSPEVSGGYEFNGSCVGLNWKECRARAEALCAQVGQTVASINETGGPQNAIVPKRIAVTCKEK